LKLEHRDLLRFAVFQKREVFFLQIIEALPFLARTKTSTTTSLVVVLNVAVSGCCPARPSREEDYCCDLYMLDLRSKLIAQSSPEGAHRLRHGGQAVVQGVQHRAEVGVNRRIGDIGGLDADLM